MTYYSPEDIEKAREIDLLTYLQQYEPENLVKFHGNVYCTRDHDSLKISNGKWMWWSRGYGGYSALDYLIRVKGMSFSAAIEHLLDGRTSGSSLFNAQRSPVRGGGQNKKLLLPERNDSAKQITKYLSGRGIARNIIEDLIDKELIYESRHYHNCIFIGRDYKDIPRYAAYRACTQERILGEATGSDKSYPFRIDADSSILHLFESAIDLLSFASLRQIYGQKWNKEKLLSMGGIAVSRSGTIPLAIRKYLKEHKEIEEIHIHFDNDDPGRAAARALINCLEGDYKVFDEPPPFGKDYNDYLIHVIRKRRSERRSES